MATPPSGVKPIERPSGRIFVVDDNYRVLMIRGQDPQNPARGHFWWTPGGGLDPGESVEEGARRELWEEIGLELESIEDLGPVVMTRNSVFGMDNVWFDSFETFFVVRVATGFEPKPEHWEPIEHAAIVGMEFLGADQIRSMDEYVYPLNLPEFLDHLRDHGLPTEPWYEDGRDDRPENNPPTG